MNINLGSQILQIKFYPKNRSFQVSDRTVAKIIRKHIRSEYKKGKELESLTWKVLAIQELRQKYFGIDGACFLGLLEAKKWIERILEDRGIWDEERSWEMYWRHRIDYPGNNSASKS